MTERTLNMTCANCGHAPESHRAGHGQCYRCPAAARCASWEPRSEAAEWANGAQSEPRNPYR